VEITNMNDAVLRAMQIKWEGTVRLKGPGLFVWTLYGRRAVRFLKDVVRYSIIKHSQIVEAFAACATTDPVKRRNHITMLTRLKHVHSH
jgi:hypothetical protein